MWRGAWGELGPRLGEGASPPAHPPSCRGGGSGVPCATSFLRGGHSQEQLPPLPPLGLEQTDQLGSQLGF